MERVYLFRGLRRDGKGWAEGMFFKPCNIVWENIGYDEALKRNEVICFDEAVEPETVGQYVGLDDVNGKKIFEGDILRVSGTFEAEDFSNEMLVYYDKDTFGYAVRDVSMKTMGDSLDVILDYRFEVVGNIYQGTSAGPTQKTTCILFYKCVAASCGECVYHDCYVEDVTVTKLSSHDTHKVLEHIKNKRKRKS